MREAETERHGGQPMPMAGDLGGRAARFVCRWELTTTVAVADRHGGFVSVTAVRLTRAPASIREIVERARCAVQTGTNYRPVPAATSCFCFYWSTSQ